MNNALLKFSIGNAKLQDNEGIFNLVAGFSCPFAKSCLAKVDRVTGKLTDGPLQQFRCYAASLESAFPTVRAAHWHNFDLLRGKTREEMRDLIIDSLPSLLRYRIHSSGDFFSLEYMKAWIDVARKYPSRTFYAYTKAMPYYLKCKKMFPKNFIITASYGGTHDHLIAENKMKYAKVVYSKYQARKLKLPIDKDDSHAHKDNKPFALMIHANGPKGSRQAQMQNKKAWASRRANAESIVLTA